MAERLIIAGKESAIGVWNHPQVRSTVGARIKSSGEDLTLSSNIAEGFGSVVTAVMDRGESTGFVVRVPKVGEHKSAAAVINSLATAGVEAHGFWVATQNGEEVEVSELVGSEGIYEVSEGLQDRALFAFLLLKQLPPGDVYLNMDQDSRTLDIYCQAGQQTREIHDRPVTFSDETSEKWKRKAVGHILSGDERFNTIASVMESQGNTSQEQIAALRKKMALVSRDQFLRQAEIVRTHGDNWEGNWWISQEGELIIFDPANAYGHRGDDIAFAIGRQLFNYVSTGDEDARNCIESFYQGYGKDQGLVDAKREMWKGLAFKMFVRAAFDSSDDAERKKLIQMADALLQYKIDNPDTVFEIETAKSLWDSLQ